MRTHVRRFTRLTNGVSKTAMSLADMVALHTTWYNWKRIHKSLRCSPAMVFGLFAILCRLEEMVALVDATAEPLKKLGLLKPQPSEAS